MKLTKLARNKGYFGASDMSLNKKKKTIGAIGVDSSAFREDDRLQIRIKNSIIYKGTASSPGRLETLPDERIQHVYRHLSRLGLHWQRSTSRMAGIQAQAV